MAYRDPKKREQWVMANRARVNANSRAYLERLRAREAAGLAPACLGPGCSKPARHDGLCHGHYKQTRRNPGKALTPLRFRTDQPDVSLAHRSRRLAAYKDSGRDLEMKRPSNARRHARIRDGLEDAYVVNLMRLKVSECPGVLIEAKRAQVMLHRLINQRERSK